jgi:hypothetical protein
MRRIGWAALAAASLVLTTAGCTSGSTAATAPTASPAPAPTASPTPAPCRSDVTRDALPVWARAGFSGDGSGVPHVFGEHGDLLAVLFEYPPASSADPQDGTKILWVSRLPQEPMQPLVVEATLAGTTTTVTREVPGGPGPSSMQLPGPGCWRLALSWSGHQDHMNLQFT